MLNKFSEFKLDRAGVRKIILVNNGKLQALEQNIANTMLTNINAQFFQQFGFEGKFELTGFTTDRSTYKIVAADKRTAAILKKNRGWLDQFTASMNI